VGPRAGLDVAATRKKSLPLPRIEPRSSRLLPARVLTLRLMYCGICYTSASENKRGKREPCARWVLRWSMNAAGRSLTHSDSAYWADGLGQE